MISSWLTERMTVLGLSVDALARYVNEPTETLRAWLDGVGVPSFESLALLSERLGDPRHLPGALATSPLAGREQTGDLVLVAGRGLGHFSSRSGGAVEVELFDGPEGGPDGLRPTPVTSELCA